MRWKQVVCSLVSIYFDSPQLGTQHKQTIKLSTVVPEISSISIFLNKGEELVSLSHFVYDFSRKMFIMLYSGNWSNFILWLPLRLQILDNMCVEIVCFPSIDVKNFEIKLISLIKSFFHTTGKLRQKCKYLYTEKSF